MARTEEKHPKPGAVEQAVLAAVRKSGHSGITSQQLALQLGYKEKGQRYLVYDALEALQEKGQVKTGKKGRYQSTKERDEAEGTIDIIASGAGYVRLGATTGAKAVKSTEDVFIHGSDVGMALHGDRVEIRIGGGRGNRLEGKVLRVIQRRRTEFVGVIHKHQGRMILVSDDQKVQKPFFIPPGDANGATEGDKAIIGLGDLVTGSIKRVFEQVGVKPGEIPVVGWGNSIDTTQEVLNGYVNAAQWQDPHATSYMALSLASMAASGIPPGFDIITGALYEKDTAGIYDKILKG